MASNPVFGKKSDVREIRTHACKHNSLAGNRLNHSARTSLDTLSKFNN
jgi:hypothetical protein